MRPPEVVPSGRVVCLHRPRCTRAGGNDDHQRPSLHAGGAHEVDMSAKTDPRDESGGSKYFYRRSLSGRELLPIVGVAVATGLLAFYVARIMMQRTPLLPEDSVARRPGRLRPTRTR